MMNRCEITALLSAPDCISRISTMTKAQLADAFGYEFSIMKDYTQNNPHHDRDLLSHTLCVLDSVRSADLKPDDMLPLSLAAMLHDIGKPATARPKQGRTVFYGHPEASRVIASKLLPAYGFDEDTCARVMFFICFHDSFINFKLPSELTGPANPYLKAITKESVAKQVSFISTVAPVTCGYLPTPDDFGLLLRICRGDAAAQAETVFMNGKPVDSRSRKFARFDLIKTCLLASE